MCRVILFMVVVAVMAAAGTTTPVVSKPFLVVDSLLLADECDSIINNATVLSPGALVKVHDSRLHAIFSSHAQQHVESQVIRPFPASHIIYDKGHHWVAFSGTRDTLIIDPADGPVFGAILFLNDNVAGGELSLETVASDISPVCGRVVYFPVTYALPKTIRRVKLGFLYAIIVYFYAVPPSRGGGATE